MHPELANLRKYILKKTGARENGREGRRHNFRILDGFLDILAEFKNPNNPIVLLRIKTVTLKEIRTESKSVRVDRIRSQNWKTAQRGWQWANVKLDGSWSESTLQKLIDESYEIALESLAPSRRKQFERFKKKKGRPATCRLDLSEDADAISELLARAVEKYAKKHQNPRTAKRHPVVTRLDLTFSLGDSYSTPWVHVNFDTKPGGEPDGAPTHHDFARLSRKNWLPAVKAVCQDEAVVIATPDGKERRCGDDRLTACIGNMLVAVLLDARRLGLFEQLPKSDHCELGVEDPTTGAFGWPAYKQRGKTNLA